MARFQAKFLNKDSRDLKLADRFVTKILCFHLLSLMLFLMLSGCHRRFALAVAPPANLQPHGPYIFDLSEDVIGTADFRETAPWMALENEAYPVRILMHDHMRYADKVLDASIDYNYTAKKNIDAYAEIGSDGVKRINFTTGLYRQIVDLAIARSISFQFGETSCFLEYVRFIRETPPPSTTSPNYFAVHNPSACPLWKTAVLTGVPSMGKFFPEYEDFRDDGILFVLLHEYAHFKYGDVARVSVGQRSVRAHEMRADRYAIEFMLDLGINPLSALPVLEIVSGLEGRSGGTSDHPPANKRIENMIRQSQRGMRRPEFSSSPMQITAKAKIENSAIHESLFGLEPFEVFR